MATVVKQTIGNGEYLYRVQYVSPGEQDWKYLGKAGEVGVNTGPIPDSTSKQDLLTNDDNAADTDNTDIELIDPDRWERNTSMEPVEHGAEKNAEKAEAVSWKLNRDRMDGGDLIVKTMPQKETGKWNVNLGFIDELESETLVVADSREEALERANRWLREHADDPPTAPTHLHPLYKENVTNGFITDKDTAEHWGELYYPEDVASADLDGWDEHDKRRKRQEMREARLTTERPGTDAQIERNPYRSAGSDWRLNLSDTGAEAADTIVGYTAANADEDTFNGYHGLQGMRRPEFVTAGGEDAADRTRSTRDLEKLESAFEWVQENEDNPEEELDGFEDVRELVEEYRSLKDGDSE